MATRAKDISPGIVQEKRRITSSPSFPRPTNSTKKNVNTTTTIAPNYIKPTKPTNVSPLQKPLNTEPSSSTLSKPTLARRSSFDNKPLSQAKKTAPAANADRSPRSTGSVVRPRPRAESLRSSSSLKAPESPTSKYKAATPARKPVPVKSTRPATTAVYRKKQPQSKAAAKNLKSTCTSADRPESDGIDQNDARKSDHEVETESCQDSHDQESICSSVVDSNYENYNNETASDMDQVEQTNEDAYSVADSSTLLSEFEDEKQSEAESENKVMEETEKLQQDDTNNDESKKETDSVDDANIKKDGPESEEEKATNNETNEKNYVAGTEEENEALDDNKEKLADKEKVGEEVSGGDQQVKSQRDNIKKMINNNSVGGSYKKESSAAYNDMIEETATKLKNQRKNKVLALVGAFESVMSLQD